jgi:hypothetical protein
MLRIPASFQVATGCF